MVLPKRLSCILAFTLSFLFSSSLLFSSGTAAVALKDYAALPQTGSIEVSPSGKKISIRIRKDGQDVLKVVDLTSGKMIAGVDLKDITPNHIYFIDEDRIILVVSEEKRVRGFIGLDSRSSAFVYNLKSNALHQLLVPGQVIYLGQYGVGRIVGVSPKGDFAYMPAFVQTKYTPQLALLKTDLTQKKRPKIVQKPIKDAIDYFMDGEGKLIAVERYNSRNKKYTIEVPEGKGWRVIYKTSEKLRDFSVSGITPDKKSLVFSDYSEASKRRAIFTMSLADGAISKEMFGRDNADVGSHFTDINRVIYGVEYAGFRPAYEFFDASLNNRVEQIQSVFKGESVWIASHSKDWEHIVVYVEGNGYSGDYFLFSKGQQHKFISSARTSIQVKDVHPISEFSYKASDGLTIPALVTIPNNKLNELKNLPAVMLPHGGPESHDKFGFDWLSQSLASQGYVVIQPQFRGSTGLGLAHKLAGRGEWGAKMQSDLTDALDTLTKEQIIDPKRVCIAGWSYGGYAALSGGAFDDPRYKCVISVNGVSDLHRMMKAEKKDKNRFFDTYAYWEDVIGKGNLSKAFLESKSPIDFVENFKAPVLLIYGDQDEIVPPSQSTSMYKALKAQKHPVQIVKIKGEGHTFFEPENRLKTLESISKFLKTHL